MKPIGTNFAASARILSALASLTPVICISFFLVHKQQPPLNGNQFLLIFSHLWHLSTLLYPWNRLWAKAFFFHWGICICLKLHFHGHYFPKPWASSEHTTLTPVTWLKPTSQLFCQVFLLVTCLGTPRLCPHLAVLNAYKVGELKKKTWIIFTSYSRPKGNILWLFAKGWLQLWKGVYQIHQQERQ